MAPITLILGKHSRDQTVDKKAIQFLSRSQPGLVSIEYKGMENRQSGFDSEKQDSSFSNQMQSLSLNTICECDTFTYSRLSLARGRQCCQIFQERQATKCIEANLKRMTLHLKTQSRQLCLYLNVCEKDFLEQPIRVNSFSIF